MVVGLPGGDGDDARRALSRLVSRVGPTHGKRGRIHMDVTRTHPKDLARLAGNGCKYLGRILRVEPVQRSIQTIIAEVRRLDAWSPQVLHRLIGKELRHQVHAPITEP